MMDCFVDISRWFYSIGYTPRRVRYREGESEIDRILTQVVP